MEMECYNFFENAIASDSERRGLKGRGRNKGALDTLTLLIGTQFKWNVLVSLLQRIEQI